MEVHLEGVASLSSFDDGATGNAGILDISPSAIIDSDGEVWANIGVLVPGAVDGDIPSRVGDRRRDHAYVGRLIQGEVGGVSSLLEDRGGDGYLGRGDGIGGDPELKTDGEPFVDRSELTCLRSVNLSSDRGVERNVCGINVEDVGSCALLDDSISCFSGLA